MIEYLANAIRATAGEEIVIVANIAEDGVDITSGCGIMLHIGDDMVMFDGEYKDELWYFTNPISAIHKTHKFFFHNYHLSNLNYMIPCLKVKSINSRLKIYKIIELYVL